MPPSAAVLAFAPHWRHEVGDVADTLRSVIAADGRADRIVGGGRLPLPRPGMRRATVGVVSDTAERPGSLRRPDVPLVRLWWNGADEVIAFRAAHPREAGAVAELDVVFFPDVGDELQRAGVPVVVVPYAFASPTTAGVGSGAPTIGYTGEVDISADCFHALTAAAGTGSDPEQLHQRAAALGRDVVQGVRSMVAVTTEIETDADLDLAAARALLWSVRNHVRHGLMTELVAAFRGQVSLRGDDWRTLGFDALPTSHNRRRRIQAYRTHRVALDLGSKSTNASLYPRSAEILALAGGLAQFHTGTPAPAERLEARRAQSAAALVDLVGTLLNAPPGELTARNEELREEYARLRLESGRALLAAVEAATGMNPRPSPHDGPVATEGTT